MAMLNSQRVYQIYQEGDQSRKGIHWSWHRLGLPHSRHHWNVASSRGERHRPNVPSRGTWGPPYGNGTMDVNKVNGKRFKWQLNQWIFGDTPIFQKPFSSKNDCVPSRDQGTNDRQGAMIWVPDRDIFCGQIGFVHSNHLELFDYMHIWYIWYDHLLHSNPMHLDDLLKRQL